MVKKTYIIPNTSIMQAQAEQILAGSISAKLGSEDIDIGFGGIDDDGTDDPSVKESNSYFELDF